ncbi:MAG: hypothetical protein ABJD13_03460 [Paracoccaceae bacterium]
MKRQTFNHLYQDEVSDPLSSLGFEGIGGKSLRYSDGIRDLRFINLGGGFRKVGALRTMICFRHQFLQPLQKNHMEADVFDVTEFPRKLTFHDFSGTFVPPSYRSNDFHRWGYDSLEYADETKQYVSERLQKIRVLIAERVLPWVKTLTPESELKQLEGRGYSTWYEVKWIADYKSFIAENASTEDK